MIRSELTDRIGNRVRWDWFATILVSLAFALDWLPAYVTGLPSSMVSLTRWVAVPLILLSMVIEPDAYLSVLAKPQVIVLGFAAVVGIGGGVAAGMVPQSTLVSFMPSLLAIVFYARRRDATRLRGVLVSLLVGAWLLCGIVVLAGLGLARTGLAVVGSGIGGATYERMWAGVSSSLLGPWLAVLLGSLGGLALRPQDRRMAVLVAASVCVGAFVAAVTAQRSVLVIAVLGPVMGAVSTLVISRGQRIGARTPRHLSRNVVLVAVSVALFLMVLWPAINERSATLRYRIAAMETTSDSYGGALRLEMWKYLAHDLANRPQLVAPGDVGMFAALSVGPHFIVGESYYYGGFLMLVAMLVLMASSVRSVFRAARWPASSEWVIVAGVIVSVLVPTLVYLTVMPGFISRLPYVLMGIALALPSAPASARLGTHDRVPTTCIPDSH